MSTTMGVPLGNARDMTVGSKRPHFDDDDVGSISPRPLDSPPEWKPSLPDVLHAARGRPNGTAPSQSIAFLNLPSEVVQRILWLIDAESFASMSLVNRQWYSESQKVELYAHHLSRCPSFALTNNLITGPFRKNDLFRLKTKFATEVRRNLFESYLRPRETLVNLISISANSSAAFPGGEAFRFSFSPSGQTLLALTSSRIFVLDLTSEPINVRRELKTLRRPLSASITDDGSLLAVLSTKHQANVYGLTDNGVKHLQVIVLDNPPRTIALAHEGTVLAAAYEGGVEVFSLAANALSTDRRAVRCEGVDSLVFSGDGSMLVGSSSGVDDPNTVVISAPFYTENDPDLTSRELHSRMWTTQILFPNNSSTCSHAALLPNHAEGDSSWLFAFDHALSSYRAVRTDDTRTGVAYFLSPPISRRYSLPSPSTIPTASECGDLVVAGFLGTGLWLYGVPGNVNQAPDMGSVVEREERRVRGSMRLTTATGHQEPLMAYSPSITNSSESIEDDSVAGKVDWRQSLFVKCRHLKSIEGLTAANWVERTEGASCGFSGKRLAVTAPGGVNSCAEDLGEEPMPVDGGRLMLLDFDYAPSTLENRVITIEVGENEPELLREQYGDHEVEVALERRRTVRQGRGKPGRRLSLGRSATSITPPAAANGRLDQDYRRDSVSQPSTPADDSHLNPFPPNQSRLLDNLHRSATAAGLYTARYPPRAPLGSPQGISQGHVVYRRREIPHESDADNWEPPPPPYDHTTSGVRSLAESHQPTISSQLRGERHLPGRTSDHSSQLTRANTTLNGMMLSDQAAARRSMNQYGGLSYGDRLRGINDSSLDTVTESAGQQEFIPSAQHQPMPPMNGRVSPPSDPSYFMVHHTVPYDSVPRRPSDPQINLSATITHPNSPPTPERSPAELIQTPSPILPSPSTDTPTPKTPKNTSITLSGSNLQNRLNHPVPPPPTQLQQEMDNHYIPPNLQVGQTPAPPALLPLNKHIEPFTSAFAPPTPDQLANLHRRVSQEGMHRRPLSISTSGPQYRPTSNNSDRQDFANARVPPSPPRAAWGAAGVPGSPSFNKASLQAWNASTTNGNSQDHGRGPHAQSAGPGVSRNASNSLRIASNQSQNKNHDQNQHQRSATALGIHQPSGSNSTPNLQGRPRYARLDTIESIQTEPGRPGSHELHDTRESGYGGEGQLTITGQQASVAMRMFDGLDRDAAAAASGNGNAAGGRKKRDKRRRERRGEMDDGFTAANSAGRERERKESGGGGARRCVVM